jgi:hypothetical protein
MNWKIVKRIEKTGFYWVRVGIVDIPMFLGEGLSLPAPMYVCGPLSAPPFPEDNPQKIDMNSLYKSILDESKNKGWKL